MRTTGAFEGFAFFASMTFANVGNNDEVIDERCGSLAVLALLNLRIWAIVYFGQRLMSPKRLKEYLAISTVPGTCRNSNSRIRRG